MSIVTTTAPDFQGIAKEVPQLMVAPGATLDLLVVASEGSQCAGVDLVSGTLTRAWSKAPLATLARQYDVVRVTLAEDLDALPDPAEPEAVALSEPPEVVGRITGRRAEKLIRPLLHPRAEPLLGSHAPALPFWERRADHPSIALVEPEGPVMFRREASYLACKFAWQGVVRELPCLDRRLASEMDRAGRTRASAPARARLVVALTPPIAGHCHKVVEAVLPRS